MCRYALYGSRELPDLCSGAGRILQASAHMCRQVDLSTWALLTGQGPVRGSSLVITGCTGDGLSSIDESLVHTELVCYASLFCIRTSVRPPEVGQLFRCQTQRSFALRELVPFVQVVPLMQLERATFQRRTGSGLCLGMARFEDGA